MLCVVRSNTSQNISAGTFSPGVGLPTCDHAWQPCAPVASHKPCKGCRHASRARHTLPGLLAHWKISKGPVCECSQDGWLELDAYYTGANRGRDPSDVMAPGAKPEGMTPSDSAVDLMHPQAHPRTLKTNPSDDGHGHAIRWLTSVIPCIITRSALSLLHCATRASRAEVHTFWRRSSSTF